MIRVIVLMTLMPDADVREAVIALAGDLALVPWARAWVPASARAAGDWRNALGPEPLEELQDIVLRASLAEHEERDWRAAATGRGRPLKSVVAGRDADPGPGHAGEPGRVRLRRHRRRLLAVPAGAGAPAERRLHPGAAGDAARPVRRRTRPPASSGSWTRPWRQYPHLFTKDRLWLMDRNYHGAARIARLMARTHVLIRLKSDIPLKRTSPDPGGRLLPRGTVRRRRHRDRPRHRVLRRGRRPGRAGDVLPGHRPHGHQEYPGPELAALYKWRWDGSETALREAKASLDGAGPGTGPMLRSGTPDLVRQELAAWAAGTEMTRGVARDAALAASPARKGRRAGQPVRPPRDLPRPHPPRRHRGDPRRGNLLPDPDQGQ